jgi:beta propeller repeat protein
MKKILLISAITVLLLILVSSTASAYTVTRITTNTADQTHPSIWSNYIVWQDTRNGGSDIYLQNLATKVQTRVTKGVDAENPFVSGNRIVWQDNRNGNWDIYMYEISTKKTTRITTNTAEQTKPCAYGNYIVWEDTRNRGSSIYLQNLVTKVQTKLSTNGYQPAIYGNKIVWLGIDSNAEVSTIFMYDVLSKKTSAVLSGDARSVRDLSLYGNRIMFNDYYNMLGTIQYDFVTKKYINVPLEYIQDPKFYSNKIVYGDYKYGNWDIFMATI